MKKERDIPHEERAFVNFVFSCSGAADVGEISDRTARILAREKIASMCCTAAVAAKVPEIIKKVETADRILVIDGCEHHCTAKVLREGGFDKFSHVDLTLLGMEKGKTPPTDDNIALAAGTARAACSAR
ncbi:MAG: zinc-binding protein [Candidatus Hydrogenedentes bacterium]|nr:zinc-binding protein [Candidatus Hydrogenedentota bacterium]